MTWPAKTVSADPDSDFDGKLPWFSEDGFLYHQLYPYISW